MRTRQEQNDDTRLQRERVHRDLSFQELGDALGVSAQAAERYCLPDGAERAITWMGRGPAEKLEAWSIEGVNALNFRDHADPQPEPKPKPKRGRK